MELLSQTAHTAATLSVCKNYDENKAQLALARGASRCSINSSGLIEQAFQIMEVNHKIKQNAEDKYFAALAIQHAKELACVSQSAAKISGGDAAADEDLITKIQLLREFKQKLVIASSNVANNSSVLNKICPLSLHDLETNYPVQSRNNDKSYAACKDVIVARTAYQTVLSAIPLSNVPPLVRFLDQTSTASSELSESEIKNRLHAAYKESQTLLIAQARSLNSRVLIQGGAAFSRSDRYALLSDPRVNEKIIENAEGDKDLKGLACSADARYGSGADQLNTALLVGSFALSGGAIIARAGSVALKVAEGANAARSAGIISLNASRLIQLSAFAVNSISAYEQIDQSCSIKPLTFHANSTQSGSCNDLFSLEQMKQDNCILAVSLSAMGLGASLPVKIGALSKRLVNAEKSIPNKQEVTLPSQYRISNESVNRPVNSDISTSERASASSGKEQKSPKPTEKSKLATSINIKMASFRRLKHTLTEFVDDPNVPTKLKELVRKALDGEEVDIIRLTDKLRSEYLIPENFDAMYMVGSSKYETFSRGNKSVNTKAADLVAGKTADPRKPYVFEKQYHVMVQDRPLNSTHNDLISFVHEIAHIRFAKFLDANIDKLAKRFPTDLIYKNSDGIHHIDEQLYHYLNERFAHEMEFQSLRSTYGRYYKELPQKWGPSKLNATESELRQGISDYISNAYGISDPRIKALRDKKISEIFIGGVSP